MYKMNENVKSKVIASLEKHAVFLYFKDNKLCNRLRLGFIISAAFTLLMTVFYIAAGWIYAKSGQNAADLIDAFTPNAIFFSICSVLLIAAIILSIKKLDFISLPMAVASGTASTIVFITEMYNVDYKVGLHGDWWWRHGIPFIICAVFAAILFYTRFKTYMTVKQAYKNLVDRLYKDNKEAANLSEDEWQEFLNNYDPRAVEEARRRAKKGLKAYKSILEDNEEK